MRIYKMLFGFLQKQFGFYPTANPAYNRNQCVGLNNHAFEIHLANKNFDGSHVDDGESLIAADRQISRYYPDMIFDPVSAGMANLILQ